jgi:hypothetical protein
VVKNTSTNFFQNPETVKKDLKSERKNLQVLCWTKVSSGERRYGETECIPEPRWSGKNPRGSQASRGR